MAQRLPEQVASDYMLPVKTAHLNMAFKRNSALSYFNATSYFKRILPCLSHQVLSSSVKKQRLSPEDAEATDDSLQHMKVEAKEESQETRNDEGDKD